MNVYEKLAELIFPDVTETVADLEKRYPERDLPEGAIVARFAPSPTGFLHTGSLFASMCSRKFAKQSGGVFFLRLDCFAFRIPHSAFCTPRSALRISLSPWERWHQR